MKNRITLLIFVGFLTLVLSSYHTGYKATGGGDATGATGGGGCSCHGSSSGIGTMVELDSAGIPVTRYVAGMSYTIKISATNSTGLTLPKFGFQLEVVKLLNAGTASAVQVGTWGTVSSPVQNSSGIIEQSDRITATSGAGANGTTYVESIAWTAPASGTGSVKIYGIINAIDNTGGTGGDAPQLATPITITEAVTPVASVAISITTGTNPTCAGSSITFTASPTNGGTTPTYLWYKNGASIGVTTATYTTSTLANNDSVWVVLNSTATSNHIKITVNTPSTAPTSATATSTTICNGSSTTLAQTGGTLGTGAPWKW